MAGAEKSPLRNIQNRWQGKMKEQHIFSKNSTYQLIEVLKTNSSYEAPAFPACNHAVHTYAGAKGRPIAGKKSTALDFQGLSDHRQTSRNRGLFFH